MNIRELRTKLKMTQKEFGEYLNIPQRTIQSWELGDRTPPEYVLQLIKYKIEKENGKMKKFEFGNIENLEITVEEGHILVTGVIPGGSIDTKFETEICLPDGETKTRHCGIGFGFIWTEWQEGHLRGE